VTPRDLVAAVDHLTTGEALELELTLRAFMAFHSTLGGSNSLKHLFASGGRRSEHSLRVE
jgi:hypothetical protein